MQRTQRVDIFWDFATTPIDGDVSGYQIAKGLREIADSYGLVRSFRTYLDVVRQQHPGFSKLKRELYTSGISIIDCPSTSREDVADKAMIVDILTLVMDESPAHTILVATGDQDISYALAILRLRRFRVILVYPTGTHECLVMQSDESINWHRRILGRDSSESDQDDLSSSSSSSSPSPSSKHSITPYIPYSSAPPINGFPSSASAQMSTGGHSKHVGTSGRRTSSPRHQIAKLNANSPLIDVQPPHRPSLTPPLIVSPHKSRAPSSIGSFREASLLSAGSRGVSTADAKPRARSDTVSGGFFFSSPPSFPLGLPPTAIKTPTPRAAPEISPVSSHSSGGFAIVNRPTPERHLDQGRRAAGASQPEATSIPIPLEPLNGPTQILPTAAPPTTPAPSINLQGNTPTIAAVDPAPGAIDKATSLATPDTPRAPVPAKVPHSGATTRTDRLAVASQGFDNKQAATVGASSSAATLKPRATLNPPKPVKVVAANSATTSGPPKSVPVIYRPLVKCLRVPNQHGIMWFNQSQVASAILRINPQVYKTAGVKKWGAYALAAQKAGIVSLRGETISLSVEWLNVPVP
ncbi:hypothetical protein D9756_001856 [Leucocoprinus leucothites]|uniref:NYN domain-containing protein n=1 Tax=Leucocoprinus leucothites TaxID=201217 RepID=A0A8H5G490_9AGAR|nr:hypothetical protein D9756_001856 [Leucoagaricus leucothites]